MYNIIPLILILISLSVIIVIVVRKFSVLANLNIETIQAEREAAFKEKIIGNRLKRNFFRYYSKFSRVLVPILKNLFSFLKKIYSRLLEIKETKKKSNYKSETLVDKEFAMAEELIKEEKYKEAENKYIEIIGKDPTNLKAFLKLGKFYYERKNYNEAKQSLEHALRLLEKKVNIHSNDNDNINSQIAGIFFDIANINKDQGDINNALLYINRALSIEANNPRYLDTKLEISIINKDAKEARITLDRLKEVNPENKKLSDFENKIKEMEK